MNLVDGSAVDEIGWTPCSNPQSSTIEETLSLFFLSIGLKLMMAHEKELQ